VALAAFYFSIKATQQHFDYTSRIASALMQGDLGLGERAPSWLNEMVPAKGRQYSVFPLGAVLSMVPVAVLQKVNLIKDFPGRALAALIAAEVGAELVDLIEDEHGILGLGAPESLDDLPRKRPDVRPP